MVERTATVDPAVDELRRKARRRLVGAVVLALAAAVILPMLLEKEPRPLGEDVSVKIPAVDDGKFVNRLSGPADAGGKPESPPPTPSPPPVPAASGGPVSGTGASGTISSSSASPADPATGSAPASGSTGSTGGAAPSVDSAADAAKVASPTPAGSGTPKAGLPQATEPPREAQVEPKAEPKATSAPAPTAAKARPTEGYVVQLAAFADDKGANALATKLKRNGYAAYTEAIQTSRGTLFRVRVGGYGSREAATSARARLKGEGYSGIVAPVR